MPSRPEPFINNRIYHIFNKTIDHRLVFNKNHLSDRFLELLKYYRSSRVRMGYSQLKYINHKILNKYLKEITVKKYFRVNLIAFCLMPNHFHLLIKQTKDKGITFFMSDIINSFTRYFNHINQRKGPIFLSDFKSVRIYTDIQFKHVSRYIHLNPYSSGLVETEIELINYPYSSFKYFLKNQNQVILETKELLSLFYNNKEQYKKFVLSNTHHLKMLKTINHLNSW